MNSEDLDLDVVMDPAGELGVELDWVALLETAFRICKVFMLLTSQRLFNTILSEHQANHFPILPYPTRNIRWEQSTASAVLYPVTEQQSIGP